MLPQEEGRLATCNCNHTPTPALQAGAAPKFASSRGRKAQGHGWCSSAASAVPQSVRLPGAPTCLGGEAVLQILNFYVGQ